MNEPAQQDDIEQELAPLDQQEDEQDVLANRPLTRFEAATQIAEIDARAYLRKAQLACVSELRRRIQSNQGVKTHNVLGMYLPLGLDETRVDQQLFIDLNTLGARRGDVAHKGLRAVTVLPDPRDDKVLAERIIGSLTTFVNLVEPALI